MLQAQETQARSSKLLQTGKQRTAFANHIANHFEGVGRGRVQEKHEADTETSRPSGLATSSVDQLKLP